MRCVEALDPWRDRLSVIDEVLEGEYGGSALLERIRADRSDPLEELILTVLSQNTNDKNSFAAYSRLRERCGGDWSKALSLSLEELEEAIRPAGLGKIKALRIRGLLDRVLSDFGSASLEGLKGLGEEGAWRWLLSLKGVGRKTASCVMLFSLGFPRLPVDTHVHRVCSRFGLYGRRTPPDRAQEILESLLPRERYGPFHLNVISHGRRICSARRPLCDECPVLRLCDRIM